MDIKTLEYMEQRAKQGRQLVEKIERMKGRISLAKKSRGIDLDVNGGTIRTSRSNEKQLTEYAAHVEASMINAFIDVTEAEIKRLEQELADL
ncbi:hypothetical protein [Brevibacillus borstelensis]